MPSVHNLAAPKIKKEIAENKTNKSCKNPKDEEKPEDKIGSHRHHRRKPPLWLYGKHAVIAALNNRQRTFSRLLITRQTATALESVLSNHLQNGARKIEWRITTRQELDQLLGAQTVHQGIALETTPLPNPDWQQAISRDMPQARLVILDQVTDPQHVGSILRSAAVFKALGVIMQARHSPPESGSLAKAACGALETVPLLRVTNLARALDDLRRDDFWCIGLDANGDQEIATTNIYEKVGLVVGAEGRGLRRLTACHCDMLVRLGPRPDIAAAVDSLSVATAAAVALYALHRL